jgi:hypothetical protein
MNADGLITIVIIITIVVAAPITRNVEPSGSRSQSSGMIQLGIPSPVIRGIT